MDLEYLYGDIWVPSWLGLYLESFQWRHLVAPMARLVLSMETFGSPFGQASTYVQPI